MDFQAFLTVAMMLSNIAMVILAARGSRWTWLLGTITGIILCYNFYTGRLYMSFAFQVYSTLAAIGGMFIWKRSAEENRRAITWGNPLWPLLVVAGLTAAVYFFDALVIRSSLPLLDCLITSLQAVATFLMVRKSVNAWVMYLICDAIYIPLGLVSGDYKWLFISACFLASAIYGMVSFVRAWKAAKDEAVKGSAAGEKVLD